MKPIPELCALLLIARDYRDTTEGMLARDELVEAMPEVLDEVDRLRELVGMATGFDFPNGTAIKQDAMGIFLVFPCSGCGPKPFADIDEAIAEAKRLEGLDK